VFLDEDLVFIDEELVFIDEELLTFGFTICFLCRINNGDESAAFFWEDVVVTSRLDISFAERLSFGTLEG
jgi:hypothetical protein